MQVSKQQICNKNKILTSQLLQSEVSNMMSEYDMKMIETYQSQINNGTLAIQRNKDLKSLEFIKTFNINGLMIAECKNIIPKLECKTLKHLVIINCNINSLKDFQLEELEVLDLLSNLEKQSQTCMVQDIIQFQKLKMLCLRLMKVDTSSLSQLTGLTGLLLYNCELRNTEALKPLINLVELHLIYNDNIDLTTLQYLTSLTKLTIQRCKLVDLNALRPLVNLQQLRISWNSIVYISPIMVFKQLSQLDAQNNYILDIQSIQMHSNFKSFQLSKQLQPTKAQLKAAIKMRDIQNQIIILRKFSQQSNQYKQQLLEMRQKITETLQQQINIQIQLISQAASLLKSVNQFESYQ
ncbi:leucine-rich_repeat domain-containing protein [Hexamita inflata]|uniref:Leucine-rich repeat domain-containing protein n=1 Tax=Hexamita inflata TaxID=28002 RepID=A0AA86N9D4_9EUKA|nr:leucine-rich repeat domain-containing protein [Hexamita inflata]